MGRYVNRDSQPKSDTYYPSNYQEHIACEDIKKGMLVSYYGCCGCVMSTNFGASKSLCTFIRGTCCGTIFVCSAPSIHPTKMLPDLSDTSVLHWPGFKTSETADNIGSPFEYGVNQCTTCTMYCFKPSIAISKINNCLNGYAQNFEPAITSTCIYEGPLMCACSACFALSTTPGNCCTSIGATNFVALPCYCKALALIVSRPSACTCRYEYGTGLGILACWNCSAEITGMSLISVCTQNMTFCAPYAPNCGIGCCCLEGSSYIGIGFTTTTGRHAIWPISPCAPSSIAVGSSTNHSYIVATPAGSPIGCCFNIKCNNVWNYTQCCCSTNSAYIRGPNGPQHFNDMDMFAAYCCQCVSASALSCSAIGFYCLDSTGSMFRFSCFTFCTNGGTNNICRLHNYAWIDRDTIFGGIWACCSACSNRCSFYYVVSTNCLTLFCGVPANSSVYDMTAVTMPRLSSGYCNCSEFCNLYFHNFYCSASACCCCGFSYNSVSNDYYTFPIGSYGSIPNWCFNGLGAGVPFCSNRYQINGPNFMLFERYCSGCACGMNGALPCSGWCICQRTYYSSMASFCPNLDMLGGPLWTMDACYNSQKICLGLLVTPCTYRIHPSGVGGVCCNLFDLNASVIAGMAVTSAKKGEKIRVDTGNFGYLTKTPCGGYIGPSSGLIGVDTEKYTDPMQFHSCDQYCAIHRTVTRICYGYNTCGIYRYTRATY